ncbi:hypothetical protein AW02_008120 [Bacillus velezensis NJN-6]|uniref:hypothetical protein n=1 Tax=Bacillus amyloliquefaciens group TaxID=1938374 RepID=UPI000532A9BA|nr:MULTISPECIES: hypothetical protein [Bacillus amyloliquefaciens group]AKD28964.1 hypothetical protein AW02_008120 [Bacillus velezensis NJN-6]
MAKLNGVKTLDMVNGEITKVAYGGSEYVKAEGLPKMGDLVLAQKCGYDITYGAFYKITEDADHEEDVRFLDDVDDGRVRDVDDYVLFRKVSAVTAEAERLKVGDYAKVVREEWGHQYRTDDVIELIEEGYTPNFKARRLLDGEVWCVAASEVVRATDEEVAEAKDTAARAKFKRGDKVRLLSGGGDYPLSGFENDKIYEVLYNNFNHPKGKRIRIADSTERFGYATPDQLEILSEEEAAEIERKQAEEAKWAKIGRKIGEYKKGDIAKLTIRSGDIFFGEITGLRGGNYYGFKHLHAKYGTTSENTRDLTLITPVEARFDR